MIYQGNRPPRHIPEYARICLTAVAAADLGRFISIGGALGLMHYLDYRSTHDADAWWSPEAGEKERQSVLEVVATTLRPFGEVRRRSWGEVESVELLQEGRAVFSFQIAHRSAQIAPSVTAQWTDVRLDSLTDLMASKMVALIERGAPRDFRDLYTVCQSGLVQPEDCWSLWRQRQHLAGVDADPQRAKLAIESHLQRIALQRPLDRMSDPSAREQAASLRRWFVEVFLRAV